MYRTVDRNLWRRRWPRQGNARRQARRTPRDRIARGPTGRHGAAAGQPEEFPPTGLTVTDSWAATAGPDGTVAADRIVPEPDSLGG